jgi:DNA-directed RNA polymerase subunit K/omega
MTDTDTTIDETTPSDPEAPVEPRPKALPIESRFLFVDVAAMRAKQLRRGALPRLSEHDEGAEHRVVPHKAERVAMEEVRRQLVQYTVLPTSKVPVEP